jgi:hypothetical protein
MSDLEASISTLVFDVPLRALDLIDELGRRSPASLLEPSNLLFHERPSMASAVVRSLKDVKPVKPPASVFNGMFLLPSTKPWVHSAVRCTMTAKVHSTKALMNCTMTPDVVFTTANGVIGARLFVIGWRREANGKLKSSSLERMSTHDSHTGRQ